MGALFGQPNQENMHNRGNLPVVSYWGEEWSVAFTILQLINSHTYFEEYIVTSEMLSFQCHGDLKHSYDAELDYLSDQHLITKLAPGKYKVVRSTLSNLSVPFVLVPEKDFLHIMNSTSKIKVELFHFYVKVIDSFDYSISINGKRKIIGHMTYSFFVNKYGIPKSTVIRYFKALEDMKLLYINRSGFNTDYSSNLYGLYCNKDIIDRYASRFDNSNKSNFHRSVSARYNRYLKNPDSFSAEEVTRLYNDCVLYNKDMASANSNNLKQLDKIKTI